MFEKIIIIAILVLAGVYVARRLLRTGSGGCGCGCDCSGQSGKTCPGGESPKPVEADQEQCPCKR
jgi:hypothetical protein